MYSKQELSLVRKQFWTSFGLYMRPVPNAEGHPVNWLNKKTGVKHIFFRMDAGKDNASIGIELRHPDPAVRREYFDRLENVRTIFNEVVGKGWSWCFEWEDENGISVSRISYTLADVSIFKKEDWPAIISFLKQQIIALDNFWTLVKDGFQ